MLIQNGNIEHIEIRGNRLYTGKTTLAFAVYTEIIHKYRVRIQVIDHGIAGLYCNYLDVLSRSWRLSVHLKFRQGNIQFYPLIGLGILNGMQVTAAIECAQGKFQ